MNIYKHQQDILDIANNPNFKLDLTARSRKKSLALMLYVEYALKMHKKLAIGTNNVEGMYKRVKELFPQAKLTKADGYLMVENGE